jgi:hypothetical protein
VRKCDEERPVQRASGISECCGQYARWPIGPAHSGPWPLYRGALLLEPLIARSHRHRATTDLSITAHRRRNLLPATERSPMADAAARISPLATPSSTIMLSGARTARGSRSRGCCARVIAARFAGLFNRVRRSSTVNRLRRPRWAGRAAMTAQRRSRAASVICSSIREAICCRTRCSQRTSTIAQGPNSCWTACSICFRPLS